MTLRPRLRPRRPRSVCRSPFCSAPSSGNAEALAAQARKVAAKLGFAPKAVDMADLTLAQAAATENLLIVASTWGEGDPPQRAVDFYEGLMADDAPRFEKTRYAVLALGDRAYAQFCEIGRRIDERLAALGGARIADRIECDLDYEIAATGWIDQTLERLNAETGGKENGASVIHVDFARPAHRHRRPALGHSRPKSPNTSACPAADRPPTRIMSRCRWKAPE